MNKILLTKNNLSKKIQVFVYALILISILCVFSSNNIFALSAEYLDFQVIKPLNPATSGGSLLLINFGYIDVYDSSIIASSLDEESSETVEAKLYGKPLVYPNPLRLSEGLELGYKLSKDMDIEIRMYDMRSNEIFRNFYPAGSIGGLVGYNSITLTTADFDHYDFPSGVYFFILINQGKVVGKGKFGVRP
jgi:hypothetical protein